MSLVVPHPEMQYDLTGLPTESTTPFKKTRAKLQAYHRGESAKCLQNGPIV